MDYELSTWYQDRISEVKNNSWENAFFVVLGGVLFCLVLTLGLMTPKGRFIILMLTGFGTAVVVVRYTYIAYMTRKLKLEFAKRAMTR